MITEEQLDAIIDQLDQHPVDLLQFYEQCAATMPVLVSYLTDADTRLLTDEEHDYMLYLGMVLLRALESQRADPESEALGEREEQVWELINAHGSAALQKIGDTIDSDVLAEFILDALEIDEETDFLTEPGAQLIFAKLSAMIACLRR